MKHSDEGSFWISSFQPKDVKFEFPDILEKASDEKDIKKGTKDIKEQKNKFLHESGIATGRRGVPTFFGL